MQLCIRCIFFLSFFSHCMFPQITVKQIILHTIQLHGLRCGMSSWIMFPGFPHLSLVIHVSKSGPGVKCVPEKQFRTLDAVSWQQESHSLVKTLNGDQSTN